MTTVPACGGCGKEVDTSKSHRVVEGVTYHNECEASTPDGVQEEEHTSDPPIPATEGNGDQNGSPTEESSDPV